MVSGQGCQSVCVFVSRWTGVGPSLVVPGVTVADDAAVYMCSATNYARTTAQLTLNVHCQSIHQSLSHTIIVTNV